ncbi:MAG: hypothetical protein MJ237_04950 [bacterium]|nr:hypothetical protein [bacterium]
MIIKKNSQIKNKNVIEPVVEETTDTVQQPDDIEKETFETPIEEVQEEQEIDLFDIENIDFAQRQERRRGSRRRGYRRIDDRNLVSRAEEEAENIKKSAYEEGYRKGLEQSKNDLAEFKSHFVSFMSAKKDVFEFIAPDIMEISVDIAKTIIKNELSTDPQVLISTIVDVLKTISKSEPKITVRVNPKDAQFVKDVLPNINYQYGIESKINVIADPAIGDGGCVFQTNNGIVDASIDTQLEIIKKALEVM